MENVRVDQEIVHPEKYKGRRHDVEGVGVKLGKKDLEKKGHLKLEGRDSEPETTADLISQECIILLRGLVRSFRIVWDDDGVDGKNGNENTNVLVGPGEKGTNHG